MFKHLDISIQSLDCSTGVVSIVSKKEFEIVDCDVKHSSVTSSRLDSSLVDGTVFNYFLINVLKHFSSKLRIVNIIPGFFFNTNKMSSFFTPTTDSG